LDGCANAVDYPFGVILSTVMNKRFARTILVASAVLVPSFVQLPVAGAASSFCKDAKKLNDLGAAAAAKSGGSNAAGMPDLPAIMKSYQTTAKLMKSLEKSAPSAIKPDWVVMSSGLQKLAGLASKVKGTDPASNIEVITKLAEITADKKFLASTNKVAAWTKKECGF
jgi:hypothetical protein